MYWTAPRVFETKPRETLTQVNAEDCRLRITFQAVGDGEKATLREYFRRNAIFFQVLTGVQVDLVLSSSLYCLL